MDINVFQKSYTWTYTNVNFTVCIYYRFNCISPKFICWSLNPQDLRIWPNLETGPLRIQLVKTKSYWSWVGPYRQCHDKKNTTWRERESAERTQGEDTRRRAPSTSPEEGPSTSFPQSSEATNPAGWLILSGPGTMRKFLFLKPPSLQRFVM